MMDEVEQQHNKEEEEEKSHFAPRTINLIFSLRIIVKSMII